MIQSAPKELFKYYIIFYVPLFTLYKMEALNACSKFIIYVLYRFNLKAEIKFNIMNFKSEDQNQVRSEIFQV